MRRANTSAEQLQLQLHQGNEQGNVKFLIVKLTKEVPVFELNNINPATEDEQDGSYVHFKRAILDPAAANDEHFVEIELEEEDEPTVTAPFVFLSKQNGEFQTMIDQSFAGMKIKLRLVRGEGPIYIWGETYDGADPDYETDADDVDDEMVEEAALENGKTENGHGIPAGDRKRKADDPTTDAPSKLAKTVEDGKLVALESGNEIVEEK